ncbi:hypothetical protein [Mitsuaria sp. GD03876]|uniref:hypothetical protein n=1 Tax=Mitsuaria sp. GD03876 TaxID=2975399 RepID=UPI002449BAF7|nr:hypothetical protein [Mitsuaria sp. GD03876]MDH0864382.1 hypothetical protein [Mitsuaria sp. GD03876]
MSAERVEALAGPAPSSLPRALAILLAIAMAAAVAEPSRPRHDDEVVERLPSRAGSATERARLRAEQRVLAQQPRDLGLALRAAREAIDRGRRFGDPRDLGTAQAWLRPWWTDPAAPPAVRLLKATVLQAQHDFDPALTELDRLLRERDLAPALRAQAEFTRAGVLQVRGRWDEARSGCERLAAPPLSLPHGQACLAELDSLQGRDRAARDRLAALDRAPQAPHAWLALLQAELAERQGRPEAGALYAKALSLDDGLYARAAYADWLLDAGRPAQAASLVRAGQATETGPLLSALPDALLLRLAIAWKQMGAPDAVPAKTEMQARFDAAALRGDTSHARERARFALDVLGDAPLALRQAELNWALQREPADAVLLVRAAQAAGHPESAAPVRAFAREHGLRDRRIEEPG